jgi:hypothetical protein
MSNSSLSLVALSRRPVTIDQLVRRVKAGNALDFED